MKVFKFGGASVKSASAVKNLPGILALYPNTDLVIVISAMGKMTNALEEVVDAYVNSSSELAGKMDNFKNFHLNLCQELFSDSKEYAESLKSIFEKLDYKISQKPSENYDFEYDQLIGYGEIVSTTICSLYLGEFGVENSLVDAREIIRTDNTYREAKVDWAKTEELIAKKWAEIDSDKNKPKIMLTQGFIGHTAERNSTTLGREGSDFTAAILAYCLNADSVIIWKDVPGMLNADPKYFKDAIKLKRISFKEAIELSYYGASVIHPKTIKPLQNKHIPLYVKSFLDPKEEGSLIESSTFSDSLIPSYIFKFDQILISITPRDFSFIEEENLSQIFKVFSNHRVRINLMQNSAINFSVCVDYNDKRIAAVIADLRKEYEVLYNKGCELVTIRHYNNETISRLLIGKKTLVEQRSRTTVRMVLINE